MDKKKEVFITNSFRETQRLGEGFAKRLHLCQGVTLTKKGACVIALYGELGSGKTTFVQGLAEGLGIKKRIVSPTFIIVRSYNIENQKSKIKNQKYKSKVKILEIGTLYHIDLYRIAKEKDVVELGLKEILDNPNNIVVIEWAEKMRSFLPNTRIEIKFSYIDREKRKIDICTPNIFAPQTL